MAPLPDLNVTDTKVSHHVHFYGRKSLSRERREGEPLGYPVLEALTACCDLSLIRFTGPFLYLPRVLLVREVVE